MNYSLKFEYASEQPRIVDEKKGTSGHIGALAFWKGKSNFSRCSRSIRKIPFANDFIHHGTR